MATRLAAVLLACAATARALGWRLPPRPPGERPFYGVGASADELGGVRMTVAVGRWPPGAAPAPNATPVELTVVNASDRPIRLRHADIALEAPGGGRYRVLPAHRLGAKPARRANIAPAFAGAGYELAPYYEVYYDFGPGLRFWTGSFANARGDGYFSAWAGGLPTPPMLRAAIPEGVVVPGGEVRGHLYFQRVPDGVDRLTYRAELADARSGRALGEIRIPIAR